MMIPTSERGSDVIVMIASLKGPEVRPPALPRGGSIPIAAELPLLRARARGHGTANYKDGMSGEGARKAIRCAQIGHCVRLHRTNTLTVRSFVRSLRGCGRKRI